MQITFPKTCAYEIGATIKDGRMRLEGLYLDEAEQSLVLNIASLIPGVKHVDYEPGYVPNLEFLP